MSKTKWEINAEEGRAIRIEVAGKLNAGFKEIKIKEIHSWYKALNPAEKRTDNTLLERMTTSQGWGMGFDFILSIPDADSPTYHPQFISMRRSQDSELFFKRPSDCSLDECRTILLPHVTFLYISPLATGKDPLTYALVRGRDVAWKQRTSKGNKNRMFAVNLFQGTHSVNPSKLRYQNITGGAVHGFALPEYPFLGMSLEKALRTVVRERNGMKTS